jgi:predicted dehydrogenase
MKFRVAIIGAGKIAQGYNNPDDEKILTHVAAFQRHGGFEVSCFCDKNIERAQTAASRWGVPLAFTELSALANLRPDVVVVSVPDQEHSSVVRQALDFSPRFIFCEKPLALDMGESIKIVDKCAEASVVLGVNYSRRAIAAVALLQEQAVRHKWGRVLSVRARYYGGWFHVATHLVDLVSFFLNPVLLGGVLIRKKSIGLQDLEICGTAILESAEARFPFYFEGLGSQPATHFELEILFERANFWIGERDGTKIRFEKVRENHLYPGFFELGIDGNWQCVDPSEPMQGMVGSIYQNFSSGKPPICTGSAALATQKLSTQIAALPLMENSNLWQN